MLDTVTTWFADEIGAPTPVQRRAWPIIEDGKNCLLLAPTGSGKTLAAFLCCIDRLLREPTGAGETGVRILYVSPLKALAHDIHRNLELPLSGLARAMGHDSALAADLARGTPSQGVTVLATMPPTVLPRVMVRTGDTSTQERRLQLRRPAEILVTTPESLFLLLASRARETLRTVETIIVDEIHALAGTKRGAHLAVSLERLSELAGKDPQRIGLSATAHPVATIARFLGGRRTVQVVDTTARPHLDLQIVMATAAPREVAGTPAEATIRGSGSEDGNAPPASQEPGLWPVLAPQLLAEIRQHRSTIIFVQSRSLVERLVGRLNLLAGEEIVHAHHGSLSHQRRRDVEEALKAGTIAGIVATSSLELGIDMGAVDLVVLIASPGSVARGLQRAGRAGHGVGEVSVARLYPKHSGDLLEATVITDLMREGRIEPLALVENPMDVLAQQIVAMCAEQSMAVSAVERLLRASANFAELPRTALVGVLDMLAGRYPSHAFCDLRPSIVWDRAADTIRGRKGARLLTVTGGGTIPDRGTYPVYVDGPGAQRRDGRPSRVGELDEEMVHELLPGQTFTLGASTWRLSHTTRDRVFVTPAPGELGRPPFWRGEGPGRPIELGRAIGAFLREFAEMDSTRARSWLADKYRLDPRAAETLVRYLETQRDATSALPSDRTIVVETSRDEIGDVRLSILTPFGARVHSPWAIALSALLGQRLGVRVDTFHTDDGICLRFADTEHLPTVEDLFPDADQLQDLVVGELDQSALFAARFRENAARALLLPRSRPGARTPLWQQRQKAARLLAVARNHRSFPIVLETYRECLRDVFDMTAVTEVLAAVATGEVQVHAVVTKTPSPFARSLMRDYVGAHLYDGDAPLAERRAQTLRLDRELLRELLGEDQREAGLDAAAVAAVAAELAIHRDHRHPWDPDALHDTLRRQGALDDDEVAACCGVAAAGLLQALSAERRILPMVIAGRPHWVAAEHAAVYRDALGLVAPAELPPGLAGEVPDAMAELADIFARRRVPFTAEDFARRHGIVPALAAIALDEAVGAGRLLRCRVDDDDAEFRGRDGAGDDQTRYCDPEILARIKRRALVALRQEIAAADPAAMTSFLPAWHGIGATRRGAAAVAEVVEQLRGLPLSLRDLEEQILPCRVPNYTPQMLDELGAMGEVVWIGAGRLGARDGRVALFPRSSVGLLWPGPTRVDQPTGAADAAGSVLSAAAEGILAVLRERGACFFADLERALTAAPSPSEATDASAYDRESLFAALAELAWAGLVTNDTLAPLRALGMRAPGGPGRRTRRGGRRLGGGDPRSTGRWSTVASLTAGYRVAGGRDADRRDADRRDAKRAVAWAETLIARHGIVCRDVVGIETLAGTFGHLYPVLRTMEEAGSVRRGHFVEGLDGLQFADPVAVEALRQARRQQAARTNPRGGPSPAAPVGTTIRVLAATDPANPHGWLLPWPTHRKEVGAKGPERRSGALVAFVEGSAVAYLEPRGGALTLLGDPTHGNLGEVVTAMGEAAKRRRRPTRIDTIDGQRARSSRFATSIREAGAGADHRGFIL